MEYNVKRNKIIKRNIVTLKDYGVYQIIVNAKVDPKTANSAEIVLCENGRPIDLSRSTTSLVDDETIDLSINYLVLVFPSEPKKISIMNTGGTIDILFFKWFCKKLA